MANSASDSVVVTGFIGGKEFSLGDVTLKVGDCADNYACIVLTSMDGLPLTQSKRMLLTTVGWAENTGMEWNEKRTSVGDRWGKGPSTMNRIPPLPFR